MLETPLWLEALGLRKLQSSTCMCVFVCVRKKRDKRKESMEKERGQKEQSRQFQSGTGQRQTLLWFTCLARYYSHPESCVSLHILCALHYLSPFPHLSLSVCWPVFGQPSCLPIVSPFPTVSLPLPRSPVSRVAWLHNCHCSSQLHCSETLPHKERGRLTSSWV